MDVPAGELFATLVLLEYPGSRDPRPIIGRTGGKFTSGYCQSWCWMPHPELAMHVRRYMGYFESSSRPVRRRELPSGEVALIISLGPHYQAVDPVQPGVH